MLTHYDLQELVNRSLGGLASQKGMVAYTPLAALRSSRFYIMGFNPRTDSANEHLNQLRERHGTWSSYTHQCWKCGRDIIARQWCHGVERHQSNVISLINRLGHEPHEIFAANAIFLESKDIYKLAGKRDLWKACWPVHKRLLQEGRPKWIICLGNGMGWSSFKFLAEVYGGEILPCDSSSPNYINGKWFAAPNADIRVLGVPHPSYFGISAPLDRFISRHLASPIPQ